MSIGLEMVVSAGYAAYAVHPQVEFQPVVRRKASNVSIIATYFVWAIVHVVNVKSHVEDKEAVVFAILVVVVVIIVIIFVVVVVVGQVAALFVVLAMV